VEVGDLVTRSYVWPDIMCGIIVEETSRGPHNTATFVVAWSDGSITEEMDMELEYYSIVMLKMTGQT